MNLLYINIFMNADEFLRNKSVYRLDTRACEGLQLWLRQTNQIHVLDYMNAQTKHSELLSRFQYQRSLQGAKMNYGSGEFIKAGYLTKSPPDKSRRVAQWHKRWFLLADSRLVYPLAQRYVRLEYYKNEEEAKRLADPIGELDHG